MKIMKNFYNTVLRQSNSKNGQFREYIGMVFEIVFNTLLATREIQIYSQ